MFIVLKKIKKEHKYQAKDSFPKYFIVQLLFQNYINVYFLQFEIQFPLPMDTCYFPKM